MIFKNLLNTIEKFEKVIYKVNHESNPTKEEYDYLDCVDFAIAESIIKDIGKSTALEISHHIIAHYVE